MVCATPDVDFGGGVAVVVLEGCSIFSNAHIQMQSRMHGVGATATNNDEVNALLYLLCSDSLFLCLIL